MTLRPLPASRLAIAAALAAAWPVDVTPAAPQPLWPTAGWAEATPESQGLDSGVLADMLDFVRGRELPLHGMVIVRHGRVVLDAAIYPYEAGRPHDIASATKSVTSILIGIAIDKGYIKSVKQPVRELLPTASSAAPDPRRDRLTVEHLLTMTSGSECGVQPGERELAAMRQSPDWVSFALALPMPAEPGARYAYCSCNNHLLSAILSAQTGESALAFARRHLFAPLGIEDATWPADPKDRTHGWGDLHLRPRDLAKIAYLFRHGGRWNGRAVVSETWVRQSTSPHVSIRDGVGYGYSWWINTARQPAIFEAIGRGGQRAAIISDEDLVVVFNGGGVDTDEIAPFLFKAIKSAGARPESEAVGGRLRLALQRARQGPEGQRHGPLPQRAAEISGTRFALDANPLDLRSLSLAFAGRDEARATIRLGGDEWVVPIGLDGRYRFSSSGPEDVPLAGRGRWLSDGQFLLDLNTVANINHFTMRLQFDGPRVAVRIDEATGELKGLQVVGRVAAGR